VWSTAGKLLPGVDASHTPGLPDKIHEAGKFEFQINSTCRNVSHAKLETYLYLKITYCLPEIQIQLGVVLYFYSLYFYQIDNPTSIK
jgi:hypothetical protein